MDARFTESGKAVTVYLAAEPDRPVIYLNTYAGDGCEENDILRETCDRDFTLAVIGSINWDHDMSPWAIPPISRDDTPCTGGADEYLRLLVEQIVPKVEAMIPGTAPWRGLGGYSLAGLFAVYAACRTSLFSRIGSMSGSLWFPDFKDYVFTREMKRKPDCIYFSLGDKECKTRNPFLKTVQDNTEAIYEYVRDKGINTTFVLNSGNHFKDGRRRTAAGIAWLLDQ